jgi:hypothetical protein
MEELATRIIDTRSEVDVDSNIKRIDSKLANLDKKEGIMKDAIKENPDAILRRQGSASNRCSYKPTRKKVPVENKIEKLHSQIVELKRIGSCSK